jgi:hypothetical protein
MSVPYPGVVSGADGHDVRDPQHCHLSLAENASGSSRKGKSEKKRLQNAAFSSGAL